ncbi:hypothetical protein [Paenarthrobacter sp. NPDC058040]|uniref:hypothetical protein n=1 Tax=unclassified Paenarthrobacter TaxID=2634190 RepID=UPI0036DC4C1A
MIKSFKYLMLGCAATGAFLSISATSTLPLALGLALLMMGAGGLTATWMSFTDDGDLPRTVTAKEPKR